MTKKEFALFAAALRTYYPKEQLLPNEKAMELWFRMLEDIPYDVAEMGLQKWVATNKWSPSISEIRELSADLVTEEVRGWDEEWQSVLYLVSRYGMYRESDAVSCLPEITKKCVQRMGWKTICMSENIAVERANFRMIYEQLMNRRSVDACLPGSLKDAIDVKRTEVKKIAGWEDVSC